MSGAHLLGARASRPQRAEGPAFQPCPGDDGSRPLPFRRRDLRDLVAGGTPVSQRDTPFPGHLDSRLRGNDGAEIAGTTKVGGTSVLPGHAKGRDARTAHASGPWRAGRPRPSGTHRFQDTPPWAKHPHGSHKPCTGKGRDARTAHASGPLRAGATSRDEVRRSALVPRRPGAARGAQAHHRAGRSIPRNDRGLRSDPPCGGAGAAVRAPERARRPGAREPVRNTATGRARNGRGVRRCATRDRRAPRVPQGRPIRPRGCATPGSRCRSSGASWTWRRVPSSPRRGTR